MGSDQTCTNQAIAGAKRKLEQEMQTLHGDCDEMASEAHLSEEKAKKAMVDAARLADELRHEQEVAQGFERDRKLLECQVKDMQQRLDEAETRIKEMTYASDEDRKNHERMQALIDQLQSKI